MTSKTKTTRAPRQVTQQEQEALSVQTEAVQAESVKVAQVPKRTEFEMIFGVALEARQ